MNCINLADYSVLKKEIFTDVYDPAEDTFVLIDALEKDLDTIRNFNPAICLEVGGGSGVVISSLGKVLKNICYLSTDINPIAAAAVKATSESNNVPVDVIITDFTTALQDRLKNSIDLLIFNPPYGVTPSEEIGATNLFCATSGGMKGREVMDRFFPIVPKLLSKKGLFYMVCIVQNDVADIEKCMSHYGFEMKKLIERKAGMEHLFALRFTYAKPL